MDKQERAKQPVSVLDTVSPALKYEAMLKEHGECGPTEDKMVLVFKVLDQIIPHMGVFVKLMQMCRDEIFEAIYSEQYTSEKEVKRYIQKIPYFTLVKRVYDERDERNEHLGQQLDTVKERLFEKQKQHDGAVDRIESLEREITDLKDTISELQEDLKERSNQIYSLEKTLEQEKDSREQMEQDLSCDVADLKDDLHETEADNAFLRQYKNGFDDLQQGFYKHTSLQELAPLKKKRKAIATKYAHLISDVEHCMKMENQLLTVQNANIEEFEKILEDQRTELSEQEEMYVIEGYDAQESDTHGMLTVTQDRFVKSMLDITTELKLLRQHKKGLMEQLQILEENKPAVKKKKKSRGGSRPKTQESSLSEGLEPDSDEDSSLDPFTINERIFSKFAAMLYTSDNNGKTYHEFKGAKFCQSCGEKTVMCPHKILQEEHVFPLPLNVSHIKIARPKVRINAEILDLALAQHASVLDVLMHGLPTDKFRGSTSVSVQVSPLVESTVASPADQSRAVSTAMTDSLHFTNSVQRLWDDYAQRVDLVRTVPRQLPLDRIISLMEQFAAYILWVDDTHHSDDEPTDILDALYKFMSRRYQETEAAYLATHDFISALLMYAPSNKLIWLLTQVLIGNLDGSVFRYILLIGDFINQVQWKTVNDFRAFAAVIYPTLTEDDLETLQMGYTSFSENKVSSSLVAEYVIYTVMKYREPFFLEMENALITRPGKDADFMTEEEFIEATDQVLAVPDNKLSKHLYRESQKYVMGRDNMNQGLPILRLAQMMSYLNVLDRSPLVLERVRQDVENARPQGSDPQDGETRYSQMVEPLFHVIGMSEVKKLSQAMKSATDTR